MHPWGYAPTDAEIRAWIAKQILRYKDHIVGRFAAIRKDTGEFVGHMGLVWSDFDELRVLEIGYMLKKQHWGNGYATEGADALVQYAFTQIGLNKVYASIRPENQRSIRVVERIGMKAEGSFMRCREYDNLYHSAMCRQRADWAVGMNLSRLF